MNTGNDLVRGESIDNTVPQSNYLSAEVGKEEYRGEIAMDSGSSLRDIRIQPLNSGYLVNVGCQSVAVETTEALLKALTSYLNNPTKFEKQWYSKDNRNRLENISE